MRYALLIAPPEAISSSLAPYAVHNVEAVRSRLIEPGFDFDVVQVPQAEQLTRWVEAWLGQKRLRADDPLVLYLWAWARLLETGELSIGLHPKAWEHPDLQGYWFSLTQLRSVLGDAGARSVVLVLDLVLPQKADPQEQSEVVAAARRVFAPELTGYSMLCAVRSGAQPPSSAEVLLPFTDLWLRAMADPAHRNATGALLVSRLVEKLREDPALYSRVPCFALAAGRREVTLYSSTSAALSHGSAPPSRLSTAPSVSQAALSIPQVLALAEEQYAQGQPEAATELFKKVLLLLGEEKTPRRAMVYGRLGDLKLVQGRKREAVLNYRKALTIDPASAEVLARLADLMRAEGDFVQAAQLRRQLIDAIKDPAQVFALWLALSEDWERAGQRTNAIEALESARNMRPQDLAVLSRLEQLYASAGATDKVLAIKVQSAELQPQAETLARALVLAADYALTPCQQSAQALSLYNRALDADPFVPRALEAVSTWLLGQKDYAGYEQLLLVQARRLVAIGAEAAEAEVWRSLARLRYQHLGSLGGAIEALDQCLVRLPNDVPARLLLAEWLMDSNQWDAAALSLEIASWQDPTRVETYRALYDLCSRSGRTDQGYLAASALVYLGEADMDEELLAQQYSPEGPVRPARSLDEDAWQKLYPPSHDPHVRAVLHVVAPSAIEYKLEQLRQQQLLPELDPAARQDPQTSTVSLTRTFVWASTVLDVPLPEIYVAEQIPGGIAAVPAETPTALVGKSVLSGRSLKELAFLVGRDITFYRPENYILVLYSSLKELTALFLAAVRVARPQLPLPEASAQEIRELSRFLRTKLSAEEQRELALAVDHFEEAGGRADLVAWARAIELAATRAGMLLCGDLAVAHKILEKDDRPVADLSAEDRMRDLLPFSTSQGYLGLRARLGIEAGS